MDIFMKFFHLSAMTSFSGFVLFRCCFSEDAGTISIIFGFLLISMTLFYNLINIKEYIQEYQEHQEYSIKYIHIQLENYFYEKFKYLDINSAQKIVDKTENTLTNKAQNSRIRKFYFKYIKLEVDKKDIAEKVLQSIIGQSIEKNKSDNKIQIISI